MRINKCPVCKSSNIIYKPWLGQQWKCNNCGYNGALVIEEDKNVNRKIQAKKHKRNR